VKAVPVSYQLSAAQKQLLASQLLALENPLCNMALAYSIDGPVDVHNMHRSWEKVASNSDALRIRIAIHGEQITQSTGHAWPTLDFIDCSKRSHPQQYAESWMRQNAATAIQPEGVLGCVALLKLSELSWVFYCNLHHLICDASSFASLWQELASLYGAGVHQSQDTSNNKVGKVVNNADEVERSDFLTFVDATIEAQKIRKTDRPEYLRQLQNITAPAPFGNRPGRNDTASTRMSHLFDSKRLASLSTLSALPQARGFGQGIGHCSVLLTILVSLLYRIGGGSTQTIGLPLPQRKTPNYKSTVGLFVEVLPLQVTIDDDTTFLQLIEQVRSAFLALLKDGAAGDSALLEAHAIPAILNYINAPMGHFGGWPAKIEWLHSGHIDSQHLIRLQVEDWTGDGKLNRILVFIRCNGQ